MNEYPSNDGQFEETTISNVTPDEYGGWSFTRSDVWSFYVDKDSPVVPEDGMTARFYGKGLGYIVRGLFLDGKKVFYRTEAEQDEHHQVVTYGKDAQEWLSRWDEGKSVWSVSMGGFGPGYEQALQIAAVEVVRCMTLRDYDSSKWGDTEEWDKCRKEVEEVMLKHLDNLGLSGSQWGAAFGLGARMYRDGPIKLMDGVADERRIQVSKHFPSL